MGRGGEERRGEETHIDARDRAGKSAPRSSARTAVYFGRYRNNIRHSMVHVCTHGAARRASRTISSRRSTNPPLLCGGDEDKTRANGSRLHDSLTHIWVLLHGYIDLLRERRDLAIGLRQYQRLLFHPADLKKARPHLCDLCKKKKRENFVREFNGVYILMLCGNATRTSLHEEKLYTVVVTK